MSTPAILAAGLRKTYHRPERTIEVLAELSLSVAAGEWVVLTGPSGCGKTTLLHLLGILDKPDAGTVTYFGELVTRMNAFQQARVRRREVGFIFQSYQLFPELTALENVMLPRRLEGRIGRDCHERALALIRQVGLADRLHHSPTELSGGEQQRIAIARALINDPKVILADEPTGNLDAANAEQVMAILHDLHEHHGKSIVMVTHDRALTRHADRVLQLHDGRIAAG
jgi:ABC-type lipoprotein export system ATPase subunit